MPRRSTLWLVVILMLAAVGLYAGWRLFFYLTDDAYIAFRYISNNHLGYGYVWNAPPFRPVEGYTSFLWVVALDLVWRLTGLEPPQSANPIALVFAAGTLLLVAGMVLRLRLSPALARYRLVLLALVLLGTLTNRTFLAWTSSGLETAMFNFWLTAWVFGAVSLRPGGLRWLGFLTTTAALTALTRPDGLLFMAATLVLWGGVAWRGGKSPRWLLAALVPWLVVAGHMLWRRLTYGAWLPNTYVAKNTGPWPESGVRYLLSFIMEYSLWFWLALALAAGVLALRRRAALVARVRRWVAGPVEAELAATVAVGALAGHFAYYTVIIGGDHFEFRVYSHLVPLLWVSLVWLLNALALRPTVAWPLMVVSLLAGLPIPWAHWAASQQYTTRLETWALRVPVASYFPAPVRGYVGVFDEMQAWLIERAVGVRHQEHKLFLAYQLSTLPPREAGLLLRPEAQAVRIEGAVGAIGWVLPTVAIIDAHGLNDLVVARAPLDPAAQRLMAHDRVPPEGYLDCFEPNFAAPISKFIVGQRAVELAALAPGCESADWRGVPPQVDGPKFGPVPNAARVIDNVWTADPLFIYYVPPEQRPVQPPAAVRAAFAGDFHDAGCLVYPPAEAAGEYQYAFLPPNLRYTPEELREIFPWTGLVDYGRTGQPVPHSLAYALPAGEAPTPATPHAVAWGPATLLGYQLAEEAVAPGGAIETELFFRTEMAVPTEQWFQLSLVAVEQPEAPLASDQGDPCRGMYPAWLWLPGQTIVAKSVIYVPPDLAPGEYALRVGMFDLAVGPEQPLSTSGDTLLATVHIE